MARPLSGSAAPRQPRPKGGSGAGSHRLGSTGVPPSPSLHSSIPVPGAGGARGVAEPLAGLRGALLPPCGRTAGDWAGGAAIKHIPPAARKPKQPPQNNQSLNHGGFGFVWVGWLVCFCGEMSADCWARGGGCGGWFVGAGLKGCRIREDDAVITRGDAERASVLTPKVHISRIVPRGTLCVRCVPSFPPHSLPPTHTSSPSPPAP